MNEILSILNDAVAQAGGTEGVKVFRSQKAVFFSCSGKPGRQNILAVKRQVSDYLVATYQHRQFNHAKVRGYRVWWWHLGNQPEGLRCGINVVPTDEELASIYRGPIKGVNC